MRRVWEGVGWSDDCCVGDDDRGDGGDGGDEDDGGDGLAKVWRAQVWKDSGRISEKVAGLESDSAPGSGRSGPQ